MEYPGLSGLTNLGNTCYMNSVIQCLSATDILNHYIRNIHFKDNLREGIKRLYIDKLKRKNKVIEVDHSILKSKFKDSVTYRFYQMIAVFWKCKSSFSPRGFKSAIDSHMKQFNGFKQHDAQEFLTALLDRIHDEIKTNIVVDKYNLTDEFQEYIIKKVSLFNQINGNISETDKQHFQMQLTQLLQENISKEIYLNGIEKIIKNIEKNHSIISDIFMGMYMSCVVCANCNFNSFTYEPFNMLTLEICDSNMNMFKNLHECISNFLKTESVEYTCERCKIKTLAQKTISIFSMPEKLIIHFKRFKFVNGRSAKINSIIDFPLDNIFFHEVQDIHKKEKLPFELYGIVHHSGGTDGGHYIATTKNLLNHKWYEFNDSSVNEVTNPNTMIDRSAYILFYQKKRITESFDDGPKADSDIDSISFEIPMSLDNNSDLDNIDDDPDSVR